MFMFVVLVALFGLTYLSGKGAVKKHNKEDDGFSYSGVNIKYPTTTTFLGIETDTAAIKNIEEVTDIVIPLEEEPIIDEIKRQNLDSITSKETTPGVSLPDLSNIDTTQIVRIRYPENKSTYLSNLKSKLKSKQCRIIHYGDSQLEGDRISGYLRNRLQGLYGGTGPGFIPIKQVYDQISARVEPSENWSRFAVFDPTKERFEHRKYGAYLSTSRFTNHNEKLIDSIGIDSLPEVEATITIGKSNRTYRRFRTFNNIGLHYGNCKYPVVMSVKNDGIEIIKDTLITDGKYHNYKIKLPETPKELIISLKGKVSPDFYGLTLDGNKGIQLDNVAMRGASGTVFTRGNATTYAAMSKELNPKVIITQYGGNAVPYVKDSSAVDKYVSYMKSQLNWLKRRNPEATLMFIGPTDMSTSINGKMTTYALLPYVNEELQKMCLENNVAYWSIYEAMGGKNTMPMWVENKLAANDYTHFSPKGTKIISELFFVALYLDLNDE